MAYILVCILALAIAGHCLAQNTTNSKEDDWKCKVTDDDLKLFSKCLYKVKPGTYLRTVMIDPDFIDEDELCDIIICMYKEENILDENDKYDEKALLKSLEEHGVDDPDLLNEIMEAAIECGKNKDHETEGKAIAMCITEESDKICTA